MSKSRPKSNSRLGCFGALVVGFIVLIVIGSFMGKARTDYFREHQAEILAATQADLQAERYDAVIATANKYSSASDPELRQLREEAERLKKQQWIDVLRREIAAEKDRAARRRKLEELLELAPGDSDAQRMLASIKEQQREERRRQIEEIKTQQAAEARSKHIQGLVAVDVYGNFTNKGFQLTKDFGAEQSVWRCTEQTTQHNMMVEVFGESPDQITLVRATYSNFSNGDTDNGSKEFLAYVASVPYEGSQPEKARSWVASRIGRNTKTTIGGASFELIASTPRVRMLLIQPNHAMGETPDSSEREKPTREVSPEERADGKLQLAKKLLESNEEAGKKWLQDVVEDYPNTSAAKEAAELLMELGE